MKTEDFLMIDEVQLIDYGERRTIGPFVTLRLCDVEALAIFRGLDTMTQKRAGHIFQIALRHADIVQEEGERGMQDSAPDEEVDEAMEAVEEQGEIFGVGTVATPEYIAEQEGKNRDAAEFLRSVKVMKGPGVVMGAPPDDADVKVWIGEGPEGPDGLYSVESDDLEPGDPVGPPNRVYADYPQVPVDETKGNVTTNLSDEGLDKIIDQVVRPTLLPHETMGPRGLSLVDKSIIQTAHPDRRAEVKKLIEAKIGREISEDELVRAPQPESKVEPVDEPVAATPVDEETPLDDGPVSGPEPLDDAEEVEVEEVEAELENRPPGQGKPHGKKASALYAAQIWWHTPLLEALGTDKAFLEWVRTQPSALSGQMDYDDKNCVDVCEAAHVRRISRGAGEGLKPPYSAIPLTHDEHALQTDKGESALGTEADWQKWLSKSLCGWMKHQMCGIFNRDSLGDVNPIRLAGWFVKNGLYNILPEAYREVMDWDGQEAQQEGPESQPDS